LGMSKVLLSYHLLSTHIRPPTVIWRIIPQG
jgi:hypothetical protein